MRKFLHDILSTVECDAFELSRVLWAIGGVVFFGLSIADYVTTREFDHEGFALALGLLLGAGAAGTAVKDTARAKAKQAG